MHLNEDYETIYVCRNYCTCFQFVTFIETMYSIPSALETFELGIEITLKNTPFLCGLELTVYEVVWEFKS